MGKPRTAAEKFREELDTRIKWWETEFDLDHFSVVGVLMAAAVDILFGFDPDEDDDEDDEDDEDE